MGNVQTRQCDARGMAQRRGSMSWNFRYPLMKRRDQTTTIVYDMKMSISNWLDLLGLQQYETNFQMYNTVEDILDLTDCGLKHRGIRQTSHRAKMLSSLMGAQAKYRQSLNIEAFTLPRPVSKRKNNCPPMYLSGDSSEIEGSLQRNCSNRNSFSNFRTNSKDSKRLTFHTSDMIYEELDPLATNTTTTKPKNLTNPVTSVSSATDNTSYTMDNVDGSGNLSSSIGGSTTSIIGQLNLQQHHQFPPNSMAVSTPSSEQQEAIALKKALEWELSLDAKDLRSHAWYHGPLSRQRAEEIVQREGEFLIRDCASQPDNYVLTCHTKTQVLHFVINKILLQPETVYERVQYQFEEDAFDAVPDLITFYVGSGKPISVASGARIQYPCNRTYPLSFYGHKIVGNHLHTQMLAGIRGASPLNSPLSHNGNFRFGSGIITQHTQQQQPVHSPMSSPPRVKREIPPRLPSKKQRSQSLTPAHVTPTSIRQSHKSESCSSADGIIQAAPTQPNEVVSISNGFRDHGRRLSNLEKEVLASEVSLVGGDNINLQSHLEHLAQAGKLHGNGFQTIARCSAVTEAVDHFKFTTHSLPRPNTNNFRGNSIMRISSLARDFGSDAVGLSTSLEGRQIPELPEKPPSPPPKPVRANSQTRKEKEQQQQLAAHRAGIVGVGYHASGSDSGNGSGDSVQSSIPGDSNEFTPHRGVIIKNPRFLSSSASSAALKSLADFDVVAAEEQLFTMEIPDFKPVSKFDFENFITLLLPSVDNKPLDGDALTTFKMMLLETGPKVIAEHITRIDIGLLIEELPEDEDRNVLDCCGLEMLTLPFGKVFRADLIERTQCMKLIVAVTILTCQTDLDRAELLSKWIQIAVETKTALGNLFGFCAIMLGLCMPQIQKLEQAWHILRQKYTDSAFTFEAKLRPTLISMNECSNPQAPNTTVPHVLLYALLKDRSIIDIISANNINLDDRCSLYGTCITAWEAKADDFGMTINFLHLDSARHFLNNLSLYRKNAKILLEESSKRLDELLSDAFRTEFHVKFLWGSNGVTATPEDRHSKLEKVLALMADKFCSVDSAAA